jgi:hypothetical protein
MAAVSSAAAGLGTAAGPKANIPPFAVRCWGSAVEILETLFQQVPQVRTYFDREPRSHLITDLDGIVDISAHEARRSLNCLLCRCVRHFPHRRGHCLEVRRLLGKAVTLAREVGFHPTNAAHSHCRGPEDLWATPKHVARICDVFTSLHACRYRCRLLCYKGWPCFVPYSAMIFRPDPFGHYSELSAP